VDARTKSLKEVDVGDEDTLSLRYRCARTVVTVSGTVTQHLNHKGGVSSVERASVVSVGGGADPPFHELRLAHRALHDQEVDLSLAPDGRLAGAGYQNTGAGAEVIGAATSVANSIASIAIGALSAMAAIPEKVASEPPDDGWVALDARADQLKKTIDNLQRRTIKMLESITDEKAPTASQAELKLLQTALALARAEAAAVEAALRAWQHQHFPDWTTTLTYSMGVDELPTATSPERSITIDSHGENLSTNGNDLSADVAAAARNLHTVVYRIGADSRSPAAPDANAHTVVYRLPRRLQLAIYEMDSSEGSATAVPSGDSQTQKLKFDLRQLVPVWVLDSNSETNQVQLSSDIFSKHAATLQFGDTGALSHIANTDVGAAANIANAIVASLGGGGTPSAAGASVAGSPSAASAATVDPTLVALAAQLARAQLEANLATANKTIRDSQTPPELTGADPPQKPTAR
jgi:hypothetical protein